MPDAAHAQPSAQQYKDSRNLAARADLYTRYGTRNWFDFVARQGPFRTDARVLDAGCGAGWFWNNARDLLPKGMSLVALDQSEGMVAEAQHRIDEAMIGAMLEAKIGDVGALSEADGQFDIVLCLHVLYHLDDPARGVAEIARVLADDGTALIATNAASNLEALYTLRGAAFDVPAVDPGADRFGAEAAQAALERSFGAVVRHDFVDTLVCLDPEVIVAFLCSMKPALGAEPSAVARLRAIVLDAFAAQGGRLDALRHSVLFTCQRPLRPEM